VDERGDGEQRRRRAQVDIERQLESVGVAIGSLYAKRDDVVDGDDCWLLLVTKKKDRRRGLSSLDTVQSFGFSVSAVGAQGRMRRPARAC
jgi:hypothetical protein